MFQPTSQLSLPAWTEIGMGLANHLWQSTVFMIAVGALTLLFRRNSAFIRYRLWLIASVKFLIPLSLLIGIGTLIGERVEWPAPPEIEQTQISFVFRQIGQPFVAAPAMPPAFRAGPPLTAGASPLAAILTALWLIGAAAVLVAWCIKWIQTARMVGKAEPFDSSQTTARIRIRTSTSRMEPGVFGILRPVLILPADAAQNLKESQLGSLIAHEMVHVRGRDNLAAALHTVVQAVFWFHPLVWWLGGKLVDERERACDEAVLQLGFDRVEYAEGILQVCRSYLKSPACVAGVSGSNLKKRIEAIMENRATTNLTMGTKVLLTLAGAGVFLVPLVAGMLNAAGLQAPVVREIQLPVIEKTTSAALPVLSQTPAPASRQTSPAPALQVAPPTGAVRVELLPVIEGGGLTILPVISQVSAPPALQNAPPKWGDLFLMLSTDEEKKAFQQLTREELRQEFIRNFWLVRDPTPGTPANEFKDEYDKRVAYANQHFSTQSGAPGSQTDRGKMYILNGPPDEIQTDPAGGNFVRRADGVLIGTVPIETWRYRRIDGKGDNLVYTFIDMKKNGEYTLEYDPSAKLK